MRIDDTPVHMAIREALANCIINADYYGRQGLVVIKTKDSILLSNPGDFRIELDAAKSGGYSDPRNSTLMKMFNLIDIGERVTAFTAGKQGKILPCLFKRCVPVQRKGIVGGGFQVFVDIAAFVAALFRPVFIPGEVAFHEAVPRIKGSLDCLRKRQRLVQ